MSDLTESPDYKYERARLATFHSWPANAKVEAWKLARAGLRYCGVEEEVECAWCGVTISDWQYGESVMARHRQSSPACPFVANMSDNVPCPAVDVPGSNQGVLPELTTDHRPSLPAGSPPQPRRVQHSIRHSLLGRDAADYRATDRQSPEGPVETDYRSEAARLASFTHWTVAFIQPADLARAGFFFLNDLDSCKCAFCHNCVGDWVEGDDPMTEHRNLFPSCPFVQGLSVGNIPLETGDTEPAEAQPSHPAWRLPDPESVNTNTEFPAPSHDETGPRWGSAHREPNSGPEKAVQFKVGNGQDPESIGVMRHEGPDHPQYATLEARLRTFRDWPPALKQQPKDLAEAGFYYIGLSDQVKCFYCDGGLRNWQAEDEPWVEHARWFFRCTFVRLVKGDEYISRCVAERPPEKALPGGGAGRAVTEEEIRQAMGQAIVKQVLSMGIDASRVKMAIKKQLESSGNPFDTAESLISAAFSVQRAQERRTFTENQNLSGALLGGLGESSRGGEMNENWEIGQEASQTNQQEEVTEEVVTPAPASVSLSPARPARPAQPTSPMAVSPASPPQSQQKDTMQPSADLESENARLKEQRTCKICMDGEVGVVFLPCGHLCCCVNCAPALKASICCACIGFYYRIF